MKKAILGVIISYSFTAGLLPAQNNVETPTMGWSSWNTYRNNISDQLILRQANAMKTLGLGDVGYTYINIDDGAYGGRDAQGKLLPHPRRFPKGLKPVVDHIHSLGFKAGTYSDAGSNTCASFWDKDSLGIGVGLYGHDEQDAFYFFQECGFDFIKIDFCGGDAAQNFDKTELDEQQRYTAIRKAISAVNRPDVRINICRWAFPGTWVSTVGSSWRISPDISPEWASIKSIIERNRFLSAYAGPGRYNDMDMLEIGRGLSEAEERTHFGMWCIMSSPLLIGCDLEKIPESSLNLLKNKELIALNQDTLGLQAYQIRETNGVALFVKDVETRMGNKRAIALYNATDQDQEFQLDFLEIDLGGKIKVRDLFAQTSLGDYISGKLSVKVGAHDTRIFLLEAEQRYERQVYEAECGWLNTYQCLNNPLAIGSAYYEADARTSGGGKVRGLGDGENNHLECRNVYSQQGGEYWAHIYYQSGPICQMSCRANDGQAFPLYVSSGSDERVGVCRFLLRLKPGYNTIRIFSTKGECPDIDAMRLEKIPEKK